MKRHFTICSGSGLTLACPLLFCCRRVKPKSGCYVVCFDVMFWNRNCVAVSEGRVMGRAYFYARFIEFILNILMQIRIYIHHPVGSIGIGH
jgi:hypothetical protein